MKAKEVMSNKLYRIEADAADHWDREVDATDVAGRYNYCREALFRAGIREVVEWIPELIKKIKDSMWKDDWGVKGVLYKDMLDSLVRKLVKAKLKEWGV